MLGIQIRWMVLSHECRLCTWAGFSLRLADRSICTDNAGMIGILAEMKLRANRPPTPLDANIEPGWALS